MYDADQTEPIGLKCPVVYFTDKRQPQVHVAIVEMEGESVSRPVYASTPKRTPYWKQAESESARGQFSIAIRKLKSSSLDAPGHEQKLIFRAQMSLLDMHSQNSSSWNFRGGLFTRIQHGQ
jgi:hypothetical protein